MRDLVGRLTLDEMVAQMSHGGGASSNGDLKLEIIGVRSTTGIIILYYLWLQLSNRACTSHISSWH